MLGPSRGVGGPSGVVVGIRVPHRGVGSIGGVGAIGGPSGV